MINEKNVAKEMARAFAKGESFDLKYDDPVPEGEESRLGNKLAIMTGLKFSTQKVDERTIRFSPLPSP